MREVDVRSLGGNTVYTCNKYITTGVISSHKGDIK